MRGEQQDPIANCNSPSRLPAEALISSVFLERNSLPFAPSDGSLRANQGSVPQQKGSCMRLCLTTASILIGVTAATFLAGCLTLPQGVPPQTPSPPVPAPSRVVPDAQPTSELRIPGEAVVQAPDIPVVPLPPIPLGQGAARTTVPTPMPEIKQVSTLPSLAPLVSSAVPALNPARPAAPAPGDLKQIAQRANDTYAKTDSYIARLTRREQINGKNKPEEVMLFKFRKQPWSVYFKWLGTEGQGREVVFVNGQYEGKIHTLLAAGDSLLMPAGKRIALAPDNVLVRSASRHPITEAGLGASVERITSLVAAAARGDTRHGTLTDLGEKNRQDYAGTLRLVEHAIPPGVESELPRGGKRLYGFDTETYLPVFLVTVDDRGQEVEFYRYDRMQLAVKLDDADFNPDKLWSPSLKANQAKP
jgi:Protein of unknown function (DUF1571)